ncbi:MAG: inositol monophosphatase family protein [Minwuia sp.]|uniref:inositol monophosphatase family protein n=1 Tax=Minwuia sp. TaxID=2493630 RepID=UPI003A8C3C23
MRKSALINVMERAARKAARKLLHDFGEVEQLQVSRKGPADFVSRADVAAEETIREELSRARPDFGFIQEEGGRIEAGDGDSYWIVDPLDGTTNFLHGLPHFAISIGLMQKGDIQAGVILAPVTDELYYAERGKGAFMNDRRLRVSGRSRMSEALFATGIPYMGRPGHDTLLAELRALTDNISGIRRFGVASLDLAFVAAGRFDGFWERGLHQWDIAAGIVLVREAGGLVTDIKGGRKMMETGDIVAGNGSLHAPLLKSLKAATATR